MNIEREQLKSQYKKYIDRFEESNPSEIKLKGFCSDHCDLKEAITLLIQAKYLDFVKEEQDEQQKEVLKKEEDLHKKSINSQMKAAIYGSILSFAVSLILAIINFYLK